MIQNHRRYTLITGGLVAAILVLGIVFIILAVQERSNQSSTVTGTDAMSFSRYQEGPSIVPETEYFQIDGQTPIVDTSQMSDTIAEMTSVLADVKQSTDWANQIAQVRDRSTERTGAAREVVSAALDDYQNFPLSENAGTIASTFEAFETKLTQQMLTEVMVDFEHFVLNLAYATDVARPYMVDPALKPEGLEVPTDPSVPDLTLAQAYLTARLIRDIENDPGEYADSFQEAAQSLADQLVTFGLIYPADAKVAQNVAEEFHVILSETPGYRALTQFAEPEWQSL